jgi:4-carboxymuconolactone decarboxylase
MPRLPEITDRDALPEAGRKHYDYIQKTRGRVGGGMAMMLHSPEVAGSVAAVGTYLRFESPLPAVVKELAALTASSEMHAEFERAVHARLASEQGVSRDIIDKIWNCEPMSTVPMEQAVPIRMARELLRDHHLTDATYAMAQRSYGDQGVVDLIGIVGYYTMLGVLFNALQVPAPKS